MPVKMGGNNRVGHADRANNNHNPSGWKCLNILILRLSCGMYEVGFSSCYGRYLLAAFFLQA